MMKLDYYAFCLLLTVLLLAATRMDLALYELDIERFYLWTSIALLIMTLPRMLS
jgi:hypothetical protein